MILTFQKLKRREKAYQSAQLPVTIRDQVPEMLTLDYMSSEGSDSEDENGIFRRVRKFSWESSLATKIKKTLDQVYRSNIATANAKRQLVRTVIDNEPSSRPIPEGCPSWINVFSAPVQ